MSDRFAGSHLNALFDRRIDASRAVTSLYVWATADLSLVTALLTAIFRADTETGDIVLCVGATRAGVVGRARFEAITDASNSVDRGIEIGAGDGATLPGAPTTFTLMRFMCTGCTQVAYRVSGDEPPPDCPEGHGLMADTA
ncbi:hypothetical protein [Streptomyces aureus]|uniref:hypothetical protein n=1 Tax=Streptomyces aureus TaxID=193461 RepID=UPI0006E1CBCF|nr:hypothetical protein [Streptomyces aureus]